MSTAAVEEVKVSALKAGDRVEGKAFLEVNLSYNHLLERIKEAGARSKRVYLGSSYKKVGNSVTSNSVRGLTIEEERVLLPIKLGVDPNDIVNYNREVNKFWADYDFLIDSDRGIKELNISYTITKTQDPVSKKDILIPMPDNIDDFIGYRMAMRDPIVAKTKEERDNPSRFEVIMTDEKIIQEEQNAEVNVKSGADEKYVELVSDFAKNKELIDALLIVGMKERVKTDILRKTKLHRFKEARPELFLNLLANPDLEVNALLYNLVEFNILTCENNIYAYGNNVIGEKVEAIAYLKNQNNNDVAVMKASLEKNKIGK